ncbi:MAG: NUDIX hydrolase [Planctomycetes bacterium]|nr:NUDIX hydrolase [Planctomycetota bacterium]
MTRKKASGVVAIVAITPENKVVLVEQNRPPAGGRVIELPAGLAGDEIESESLVVAAQRELVEETGYIAKSWSELICGLSSSGLTDEAVTFFHAKNLCRVGSGGGVANESIRIHEVHVGHVATWINEQIRIGMMIDLKLLAGLFAAQLWGDI